MPSVEPLLIGPFEKHSRRRFVAALLTLICIQGVCAQSANPSPDDRAERWRQDLKYFASEFPARHKDFTKLYSQPNFNNEIAALHEEIPRLSDSTVALRLMKLVAGANIGHTTFYLPQMQLGFWPTPLTFKWYSDGLAVIAAAPIYAEALGTRVSRIGTMTPEQLLKAVAPYVSHENETWLKEQSSSYMRNVEILKQVGAIPKDGPIELTVTKPNGESLTLTVVPAGPGMKQITMFDGLKIPAALHRKRMNRFYWYEYLPESTALYIQYNKCQDDPKLPFKDFVSEVFSFVDSHPVGQLILDLRFNGGGDSSIIAPLISGLKKRKALNSHVSVLIGSGTFSSAQLNALEFRRHFKAKLIGEATGEKPNGYGEVRTITLPNSGLIVQYCTKYFRLMKDSDPSALEPDVRVATTLSDVRAGRDPVLEAALKLR